MVKVGQDFGAALNTTDMAKHKGRQVQTRNPPIIQLDALVKTHPSKHGNLKRENPTRP